MAHKYTKEEHAFIVKNVKGKTTEELTSLVNKKFKLNLQSKQIRAYKKNHKLTSGIDARFKKGNMPYNKGKKIGNLYPSETQFKKGHVPHNYLPIGTQRINGDGYIDIKIKDPNKWKPKHLIIWEEANGPVPKGSVIAFADKNKQNVELSNLVILSRRQLQTMNQKGLITDSAELTKTGIIIADLHHAIYDCIKNR